MAIVNRKGGEGWTIEVVYRVEGEGWQAIMLTTIQTVGHVYDVRNGVISVPT